MIGSTICFLYPGDKVQVPSYSTTFVKFTSTQQSKDQRQDRHRQHSRQVYGNKTRSIKESRTHRTEIRVHETIGARRHH